MQNRQNHSSMPYRRYTPYHEQFTVDLPTRQWPSRRITQAPRWCAVDLRDGNQALVNPMNLERKLALYHLLVRMGYKEIEVGFPAASQTDFDFTRHLIENGLIPEDVTIQVLTQAREHLIERTVESLVGAREAVLHVYNSTSALQREVVFQQDREGIKKMALKGAQLCQKYREKIPQTHVIFEYSPESFTGTEIEYAADICNAVAHLWEANSESPIIINLPATVEMSTPNVYADAIEWMDRNLAPREGIILSIHPHNDRGTAIAAAELGYLAGAQRIEGCLFGNGERTGNVDLVTLGLNLMTQGIDPNINFAPIDQIRRIVEHCNELPVPERTPYAGGLVFTAFSGSHQDAIKKGFDAMEARSRATGTPQQELPWRVPYLPIDPQDLGRTYEAIVRVNSQSGKGAIAYLLKSEYGLELPQRAQSELAAVVQRHSEQCGGEVTLNELWDLFAAEYLPQESLSPYILGAHTVQTEPGLGRRTTLTAQVRIRGVDVERRGEGNGPIDALIDALSQDQLTIEVLGYSEHALSVGGDAQAASYIECRIQDQILWGIGLDSNTTSAALQAVISAVNRALRSP